MSSLEVRLFGPPAILVDGEPMPRLKTRKGLWLLSLLALRQDREVDRTWLAGTLWPDADEAVSLTYLRQALTDLRKALGAAGCRLESRAFRSLCLRLAESEFDVGHFDRLIERGTPEALDKAVALYSGPLLEGCTEEWVLQEREQRGQAYLRALEALASHETDAGEPAAAVRRLRQVISAEPLRESAYSELMRALAAVGDSAAVMDTYRDLRLLLRKELNTEPGSEVSVLYHAIRNEARNRAASSAEPGGRLLGVPAPAEFAKDSTKGALTHRSLDRSAPPGASNVRLPRFVSDFIGREREVAAIRCSLSASRLVTLTGVGGVGKTRLAVRLAELEAGGYADGAVFVDLASLLDSSLVADVTLCDLGLRQHPTLSSLDVIADHLEKCSLLLVLDNCEHVVSACAELASTLLKRCPDLKILATSRQRLGIFGETEWRVPPLEVPPVLISGDADTDGQQLRTNESMSLFLDRALRIRPTLSTDIQTLRVASNVCRRLDGIPLALELAAGRLQALTVLQLADRLEERFKLLVGGDVTAPSRQRTLRAMLDWSYELLSEDERILFRRLAVFSGGWTLEAAEIVCFQESSCNCTVLDGLASLVEKSIVVFRDQGGVGRYGFLETVRQYAREKLARSGEEEELRLRHANCFLHLCEEASVELQVAEPVACLDRLEAEHDNIRSVLDWCIRMEGRVHTGLRLAGALRRFWALRSHFVEGRRWYAELIRRDTGVPASERALALHGAGNLAYRQGDYSAARELFEQALEIRQSLGDCTGEAETRTNLGNVAYFQGHYGLARTLFTEALELHRSVGSRRNAAVALQGLGNIAFRNGETAQAREFFKEGLTESLACGSRDMEGTMAVSLGILEDASDNPRVAMSHFQHALGISQELGDTSQEMVCLVNLGGAAWKLSDLSLCARHYRAGLQLARGRPGDRDERVVAYLLEGVAYLALRRGDMHEAGWLFSAGSRLRESIGAPYPFQEKEEVDRAVTEILCALGESAFDRAWSEGASASVDLATMRAFEVATSPPEVSQS